MCYRQQRGWSAGTGTEPGPAVPFHWYEVHKQTKQPHCEESQNTVGLGDKGLLTGMKHKGASLWDHQIKYRTPSTWETFILKSYSLSTWNSNLSGCSIFIFICLTWQATRDMGPWHLKYSLHEWMALNPVMDTVYIYTHVKIHLSIFLHVCYITANVFKAKIIILNSFKGITYALLPYNQVLNWEEKETQARSPHLNTSPRGSKKSTPSC